MNFLSAETFGISFLVGVGFNCDIWDYFPVFMGFTNDTSNFYLGVIVIE